MKTVTVVLAALLAWTNAQAEQRINPMTGEYEVVVPGSVLRFNGPAGHWSYVPPGATPELNRSTLQWEYPGQSRPYPSDPVPYQFRRDTYEYERDSRARDWPEGPGFAW